MGTIKIRSNQKYEMVAPDGGYAHIINVAAILMLTFSIVPISSFALIFGPFVSQFNDETSSVTIVTSVYMTLLNLTGLLASFLLQKLSYRKVALIGAFLYVLGSLTSIFVTDLIFLTISYGLLQGVGTGLLLPSALSAINVYFDRKKTLAMAIGQTVMALVNIVYPGFTRILLENYGFRGTQSIFTAISLNIILGALLLHPVKWHLKRRVIEDIEVSLGESTSTNIENSEKYSPVPSEIEAQQLLEDKPFIISPDQNKLSKSLTSLASATSYLTHIQNEEKNSKKSIMDFTILKDGCYWNLVLGLAISVISETNFMAILPISFFNMGYTKNEVTLMMTIFFTSDLVTRIILSLVTAFCVFSIQQLFLINVLITIILRIVFVANHSFWFLVVLTALMGSSRCLIQVPVPMVIAEIYAKKFTSAYSLYMVFNGVLSIIIGALIGLMKHQTGSHEVVLHSLTAIFFLCAIPWTIQVIHNYWKSKRIFSR